ncbi:hypothetical protein COA17_11020 [Sphingomonas ginsenosidimutans]|uniref:Uncharacterized protein n=1 Tax=Sphingomonas ginsenosidimutans TaxID=862134 RepID=A0A2A4HWD9_9SPHN|nr:hypothetical protein COA17_11020 [Sphingomonas ginsenosidimutans]
MAPPAPRAGWHTLAPVILSVMTFLVTLATIVFYGGQMTQRIGETERRVVQLEQRADRRDGELQDLGRQLARVDAKLDLLIDRLPKHP